MLDEQFSRSQVGIEAQSDQRLGQVRQGLKDMVTVKLTQVKGDLERAMEQKIIQGLEPWLRKGGIIEGARSAESLERTVTVKGKQPMGEEQYTSESLLNTGSREVSLYDMFL